MANISSYTQQRVLALSKFMCSGRGSKDLTASGKLGRAYGSLLFSILNMGRNVATRGEVQHPYFADKPLLETGKDIIGSYSRSEKNHPGYTLLRDILKDAQEYYAKKYKLSSEQVTTINQANEKYLTALRKFSRGDINQEQQKKASEDRDEAIRGAVMERIETSSTHHDAYVDIPYHESYPIKKYEFKLLHEAEIEEPRAGSKTWLGQYLTPEERLEIIFSQLCEQDVLGICSYVMEKATEKKDAKEEALVQLQLPVDFKGHKLYKGSNFNVVMDYRQKLTRQAVEGIIQSAHINVSAPKTNYPCVIFDLRGLIKCYVNSMKECKNGFCLEFDYQDLAPPSESITYLNNLLLSYFCGLMNRLSVKSFGEHYIEMQPQGSFGSIRPSITDTGFSFRVSLGLVPTEYCRIFAKATNDFLEEVEANKNNIYALLLNAFVRHKENVEEKDSILKVVNSNSTRMAIANKAAQGVKLRDIVNYLDNTVNSEGAKINLSELATDAQWLEPDVSIQLSEDIQAPDELSGCINSLIQGYLQWSEDKSYQFDSETMTEGMGKAIKGMDSEIAHIINEFVNSKALSFPSAASYFETLLRLLQIRQELLIVAKYSEKSTPVYQLKRSVSMDSTLSMDGDDDTGVGINVGARSGMSALTRCINILSDTFDEYYKGKEKHATLALEEVYFEVGKDYVESVKSFYLKDSELVTGGDHFGILQAEEKPDIRLVDIAAFPRYRAGISQISPWLNSWDSIPSQPKVLLVDVTSASEAAFLAIIDKFKSQKNIYAMLVFASNNKYGQGGVDLSCMGELRLFTLPKAEVEESGALLITKLIEQFKLETKESEETTVSMKAYRQVLQAAGLLRTSKPEPPEEEGNKLKAFGSDRSF